MIKAVIFDMYETLITLYKAPLYFGAEMARDAGIDEEKFKSTWRSYEEERTVGKLSFEEIIELILRENNKYSNEVFDLIINKRVKSREDSFENLHEQIMPMLETLKDKGILVGLISNCYSEEAMVIKKSNLAKYFDVMCLSYDEGVKKPNPIIFQMCMERLKVEATECLYVGDGGSNELEAASLLGMKAVQACWYVKDDPKELYSYKDGFENIEEPMDIIKFI